MNKRNILIGGLTILAIIVSLACATSGGISEGDMTIKPQSVTVVTQGVTIAAEDGSFKFESGQYYPVPFANGTVGVGLHAANADVINLYSKFVGKYAKPVLVTVPGLDKPLYGLLLLSYLYYDAIGPAVRSYQIAVPQSYVAAATGGRISVVYETYDLAKGSREVNTPTGVSTISPKSWVLWLSDMPFITSSSKKTK